MVSIKDVAEKAKVAKSTVSLVLNNRGYVSEETRQKVIKAMKELNYVPNQLAKNLSTQKSNIIGIVMPDISHPFFSTFIKSIEKELYNHGYKTMVCGSVKRGQVEEEYIDWLNRNIMDGIIMGAHTLDIDNYVHTNRPVVCLDRFLNEKIPMITSNHKQAAELTVERLLQNQCKNVVKFVGSRKANVGSDAYSSYCKELFEESGGELHFFEMVSDSFTLEEYHAAAVAAFNKYPTTDAFIGPDLVITQCLKIALEKKLRVPEDLKLIAYDGTYITRALYPQITAIVQPIEEFALIAAQTILKLINGEPIKNNKIILDVRMQEGQTTF